MPPKPQQKYWYTVSIDSLRLWVTLFVLAVLATGGYWGYQALERHLSLKQVEYALEEGRDLVHQLSTEKGLGNFSAEFARGRDSLVEAQEQLVNGDLQAAITSSERGRTVLRSILETLRDGNPSGAAKFIAVEGSVEYRRGERGEWLTARSRVALYPGDYVKTGSGGSAEVMTIEGSLFTVRPDTVILVDRSVRRDGAVAERTISLESGWVNLSTSQATSRITTPEAEALVERRSEATVAYNQESKEARFTAVRGNVAVTSREGGKRQLGERQQLLQRGAALAATQTLPEAPTPLGPRDNLELFLTEDDRLVLSWQPVAGAASYALQVSRNRLFVDNIIEDDQRAKTEATLGLQGEGTFIWRVAANERGGERGPWSLSKRFRVSSQRGLPAPVPSAVERPADSTESAAADRQGV